MSERNFARAFRRETGMTPAAYVELARVERARIALDSGDLAGRGGRAPSRLRHRRDDAARLPAPRRRQPRRLPQPLPLGGGLTNEEDHPMKIAIPLYDRFTALDAVGPYEVLSAPPRRRDRLARRTSRGPCGTDTGMLAAVRRRGLRGRARSRRHRGARRHRHRRRARRRAPRRLDPARPRDLPVDDVGVHRLAAARRGRGARRARRDHALARPRTSSSASGRARPAGAWSSRARSSPRPACRRASTWRWRWRPGSPAPEVAQAIQLGIEYDPQPPFDAGSTEKAPPEIVELVRTVAAART